MRNRPTKFTNKHLYIIKVDVLGKSTLLGEKRYEPLYFSVEDENHTETPK